MNKTDDFRKQAHKKCVICESDDVKRLFTKDAIDVVKCRKCGMIYSDVSSPKEDIIKTYQTEDYFCNANEMRYGYHDYREEENLHALLFGKRLELISKYASPGKLLDIGCALGFSLKVAKEQNWDTYGVEVSAYAADYARKYSGAEIFNGTIEDAPYQDSCFDVVVMEDVLEHMIDPVASMKKVNGFMKKGALVAINTPNTRGYLCKTLGRHWPHYKPLEHLSFFSPKTIKTLLDLSGFAIIDIRKSGKIVTMQYIANRIKYYHKHIYSIINSVFDETTIFYEPFYLPIGELLVIARKK